MKKTISGSLLRQLAFYLSILLFLFSLTGSCFCTESRCVGALEALLMGWLTVPLSLSGLAWLANPLLIISWVLTWKEHRLNWLFALLAAGFSLLFLAGHSIPRDEAGNMEKITGVQGSYWLWVAACLVQLTGSIVFMLRKKKSSPGIEPAA